VHQLTFLISKYFRLLPSIARVQRFVTMP